MNTISGIWTHRDAHALFLSAGQRNAAGTNICIVCKVSASCDGTCIF